MADETVTHAMRNRYGNHGRVNPYPLPFINLRLQKDNPSFRMDTGKNHVYVGEGSGLGPFDNLNPIGEQSGSGLNAMEQKPGEKDEGKSKASKSKEIGGEGIPYVVEFPTEEEEGVHLVTHQLHHGEEIKLVAEVNQSLSLKRNRILLTNEEEDQEAEEEHVSKKQGIEIEEVRFDRTDLVMQEAPDNVLMAEEAGQSMPPQSK